MKLLLSASLLILVLAFTSSDPLAPLRREHRDGWNKTEDDHAVVFRKNDSLSFMCCILNPISDFDTASILLYTISVTYKPAMHYQDIVHRIHLQDSILNALSMNQNDRARGSVLYHTFKIGRNTIDSLMIPAGFTKDGYAVYIQDALELYGYKNFYIAGRENVLDILDMRKKLFRKLGFGYQEPNWLYEYAPDLSEEFKKAAADF